MHTFTKEDLKVRPNCALPVSFFQNDMVVCTGEDPSELVCAMQAALPGVTPEYHEYRCYRAWKYPGVTVVISGIGTGCLEPLLYELLDHEVLGDKVAQRLVMIGTAGFLSDSGFGQVYLVNGAYTAGCGVMLEDKDLPIRPSFGTLDHIHLPRAEEISTDYYYACTPQTGNAKKNRAKAMNPSLAAAVDKYWKPGRLISMESAQFYAFCSAYGKPGTQYVALRGVANLADQFETQGDYSLAVLTEAFKQALQILGK